MFLIFRTLAANPKGESWRIVISRNIRFRVAEHHGVEPREGGAGGIEFGGDNFEVVELATCFCCGCANSRDDTESNPLNDPSEVCFVEWDGRPSSRMPRVWFGP